MFLSSSELRQLDLLKNKTPAERFLMMTQLIAAQVEAMKAGIRYKNPTIDDAELDRCLKSSMKAMYSLKR